MLFQPFFSILINFFFPFQGFDGNEILGPFIEVIFGAESISCSSQHLQFSNNLTDLIQLWPCDVLRLRRCELIPLFTPLSHCHRQRQTHSLASRILFAVIVPSPLKFLIALCCLLIHALSSSQITMGYSE